MASSVPPHHKHLWLADARMHGGKFRTTRWQATSHCLRSRCLCSRSSAPTAGYNLARQAKRGGFTIICPQTGVIYPSFSVVYRNSTYAPTCNTHARTAFVGPPQQRMALGWLHRFYNSSSRRLDSDRYIELTSLSWRKCFVLQPDGWVDVQGERAGGSGGRGVRWTR